MAYHLPGDYAEKLKGEAQQYTAEAYNLVPTMIANLAEVLPLKEQRTIPGGGTALVRPEYRKRTVLVGDYQLEERAPGEVVKFGHEQEGRVHIARRRGYSKKWAFPKELLEASDYDGISAWMRDRATAFGQQLAYRKDSEFAKFFNKGAILTGNDIFNNVVPGVNSQGAANGLLYDGKPLFALSGNNHPNLLGVNTYYNATANALTAGNLATSLQLMRATNNRDEYDRRVEIMPDTLLIPQELVETAVGIVEARGLAGTGNNDANPFSQLKIMPWSLLEDTDAWFTLQAKKGFTFYDDDEVIFEVAEDPDTRSEAMYAHAYWALMVHDWRYAVSNALATS